MLLSSTGPLALKWNYVPKMIPWFLKFILNTSKKKMMHNNKDLKARNMHQILIWLCLLMMNFLMKISI